MRSDERAGSFNPSNEVALAGAAELNVKKFKSGDNVRIANFDSPTLKVIGYGKDPRNNEVKVIVVWFAAGGNLVEAAFDDGLLEPIPVITK